MNTSTTVSLPAIPAAALSQAYEAQRQGNELTYRTDFSPNHWREFSLRAWWNRKALDEPVK